MNSDVTKNAIPNLFGSLKEIPKVDETLTKKGASADAKAVGDKFAEHRQRIDNIDPHFARNVEFDNADSGLEATSVQGAIDDLKNITDEAQKDIANIFTANKPSSYYVGNGDTTSRKITTNGVGGVVLVYSNNAGERNICLVTKIGAISFRISGETATKYMGAAVLFADGVLSLGTADSSVNANGVNYYYQVL